MTLDEAKALFALMGWPWKSQPLSVGNNRRGRLPEKYKDQYDVFVNLLMVEARRQLGKPDPAYSEYERYDVDRCLTRYAQLYLQWIAEKG